MSERKNIDRLFQEKFKDFEVNPPEDAWANIEAKLDNKKKRRVIPFWWKLSGVAAVFLIGFLISKSIYDDGGIKTENPVVNESNSYQPKKADSKDLNKKGLENNSKIQPENAVANESGINKPNQKNSEGTNKNNASISSENSVATTSDEVKNNAASENKKQTKKTIYSATNTVAERKPSHNRSLKNKSNAKKDKTHVAESVFEKSQDQVAQNTTNKTQKQNTRGLAERSAANQSTTNNKLAADKGLAQTDSKEKKGNEAPLSVDKKSINLDDLKGNVNSKIATKETDKKVNDTLTAIKSVATNELEELLNEKESKKKESKRNRWQLASNVAPIFLGSASNGSPIDSTLSKNSKSYNTNVGFGIGVSYAVNNKLSVRTGINKVNMSYDTNNISFFTGIQAKILSGVHPNASSAMIHVESNTVPVNNFSNSEAGLLPFESTFAHKTNGSLRQEMSYLEMPMEMTYNLLDKKFGIKIIGGFSTLFLQDNNIVIMSSNGETTLGEANNLNDVHFSTNLGLGVKYNFLKSFEFNVEPTVKYQLNTYNSNAGNFKPYLFGIYSGISYKF